jgi:hypothetical protein
MEGAKSSCAKQTEEADSERGKFHVC